MAPSPENPDSTTRECRELFGPCTTRIDGADHIPGELFESTEQDEQERVDGHFGLEIGRLDLPAQALLKAREAARAHRPRMRGLADLEEPVGASSR